MIKFVFMKQLSFFTIAFVLHLLMGCTSNVSEKTKEFDPSKKTISDKKVDVVAGPDSLLFWKERYQSDSVKIKFDSIFPSFTRHFIDRFNAKSFIKNKLPRKKISKAEEFLGLFEFLLTDNSNALAGSSILADFSETNSFRI